jgi:hypothetical protein
MRPSGRWMLSLWKLRVGAEAYYLGQVARGLDDYYIGGSETRGRWIGTGAGLLDLADDVTSDDLRAVLAGVAPGTALTPNGTQIRTWKGRVPGFDLTFSAPKSVSVMYAFGDVLTRNDIVEALDCAVGEAMGWLEREACFVRRGSNNRDAQVAPFEQWGTRRLHAAGFIAAAPVTHNCIPMYWSRILPKGLTAAGPRSTAKPCTGPRSQRAPCSKQRYATNCRVGSVSSGCRSPAVSPTSPGSLARC